MRCAAMHKMYTLSASHQYLNLHNPKLRTFRPTPMNRLHQSIPRFQLRYLRPHRLQIKRINHHIRAIGQSHLALRLLLHRCKTLRMRLSQMRNHRQIGLYDVVQSSHIRRIRNANLQQRKLCRQRNLQQTQRHTQLGIITARTLAHGKIAFEQRCQPLLYDGLPVAARDPNHNARQLLSMPSRPMLQSQ